MKKNYWFDLGLAILIPVVSASVAVLISSAVAQSKIDTLAQRADYRRDRSDVIEQKVNTIAEDVAEMKGMLKEMEREKRTR